MTKEITVTEDCIRERAYLISEEAGHPHGRCDEFWHRARSELHAAAAAMPSIKARRASSHKTAKPVPAKPAPAEHPVRKASKASKANTAAPVAAKPAKAGLRLAKSAQKTSAKMPSGARKVRGSVKAR